MADCGTRLPSSWRPYVVLVGDVGSGKSTLVEKLTGYHKLSSSKDVSFTKTSTVYSTHEDKLQICDTPGSNPLEQRFEHNFCIALAMSYKPVSCLLIVVQARARMANVIEEITKYASAFESKEFTEIVGVCVTHMDTVSDWDEQKFRSYLSKHAGITRVVFSCPDKSFKRLRDDILGVCNLRPVNFHIDSDNFLRFFRIDNSDLKILRSIRDEVNRFEEIKQYFFDSNFREPKSVIGDLWSNSLDMLFEFQAWMTESITDAQKRVAEEHGFAFDGPEMANEAGHIAHLTNQLKAALLDVRSKCLGYTSNHGADDLRKCPHCGLIWAKVIGCDGLTFCGELVNAVDRQGAGVNGFMATFTFVWDEKQKRLTIKRSGGKHVRPNRGPSKVGCGMSISWNTMPRVQVPEGFSEQRKISVDDVGTLPKGTKRKFDETFREKLSQFKVEEAPRPPPSARSRAFDEMRFKRRGQ